MNYMAIRAESDMNVRSKDFQIRRKEEHMVMKQRYTLTFSPYILFCCFFIYALSSPFATSNLYSREFNVAMKQLRKAKYQLEFIQKSVPELQNIMSDTQRELEAQKTRAKQQKGVV